MIVCGCGNETELFEDKGRRSLLAAWAPMRVVCPECGNYGSVLVMGERERVGEVEGFMINGIFYGMNERAKA